MVAPCDIEKAVHHVTNKNSLLRGLLADTLEWPIPEEIEDLRELVVAPATGDRTVLAVDRDLARVFDIDDATKVIIFSGEDKKEYTGKAGLQNEQVKEGVGVFLVTAGGKVTELRVGSPPGKKKGQQ